ncbi:MAG: hypothetical protein Q8P59_03590, partial [Dehalococcoidia bacterium]|nr:hypothetical protein [Dehalococcoidia bacterium]
MRKQALEKALKTFLTFEDLGPRQEELEYFFQRYPQVPREVILKEDLLRLGFTFSEAALQASAGCRLKSYRMFSYDRVKLTQMGNQEGLKVPEDITIQGGIYGLRPLIVRVQVSPNSPYQIDVREDRLVLLADGLTVAEVAYPPAPAYYSRCFEDGTPYYQVVPMVGGGRIPIVTASRYCQHWGVGEQCQFCDISETARELAKLGKAALARTYKKVEQVVQVMETIFQEEKDLPTNPRCFTITGGTITGDLQGLDDTHFYLQYVEAVRERIGREWRGALSTEAKPRRDLETFRAAGVDVHMANIEVWEP